MKHSFPCGHKGKGKTCHRCQQADKLMSQAHIQSQYGGPQAYMFRVEAARQRAQELKAGGKQI